MSSSLTMLKYNTTDRSLEMEKFERMEKKGPGE